MRFDTLDPDHPDARSVLSRLSTTLIDVIGDSGTSSFSNEDVRHPRAAFVVGYVLDTPVACGALRPLSAKVAELKRMCAEGGTGYLMLRHLEDCALDMGYARISLSTRVANENAVRFYQKHAYRIIANYGKYAGRNSSICFEKSLAQKPEGNT